MIAVIGDIHGCYYTLLELVNQIRKKYPHAEIISLGDLVDRGNHSFKVVDFVMNEEIRFVPGNHDYMFYHFFKYPSSAFARSWVFNGNEATLESYEGHEEEILEHIDFIANAPLYLDLDDAFITHAGISKYYENILPKNFRDNLEATLPEVIHRDYLHDIGVLWTRDPLLDIGKIQIVGHSKINEPKFDVEANALYIDTGAFAGNKLSAAIVEDNEVIEILSEKTHIQDYRIY
jgi:serine/threonine protein phosphatase 1